MILCVDAIPLIRDKSHFMTFVQLDLAYNFLNSNNSYPEQMVKKKGDRLSTVIGKKWVLGNNYQFVCRLFVTHLRK